MELEQVKAIRWSETGRSQEREDQPMGSPSVCGLMGQMSDTHRECVTERPWARAGATSCGRSLMTGVPLGIRWPIVDPNTQGKIINQ